MREVEELLRRAARKVVPLSGGNLSIRDKNAGGEGAVDLVTDGDLAVDRVVTEGLGRLFPGVPVVSEERPRPEGVEQGDSFILDPVDGTHNFTAGVPWWAISLARVRGAEVEEAWLLNLPAGLLYHAVRGGETTCEGRTLKVTDRSPELCLVSLSLSRRLVPLLLASERFAGLRMMGCHSLALAYAAEGRFGLHASRGWPWDVAAGYLLIERAGGRVVDLEGRPRNLWEHRHALAGAPACVDTVLEILAQAPDVQLPSSSGD